MTRVTILKEYAFCVNPDRLVKRLSRRERELEDLESKMSKEEIEAAEAQYRWESELGGDESD
jgi:hypothetical protein